MSGIGEISAIVGTIQFAVWLGTTLNTYIGDTKDAYGDVQGLAQTLRALCGNIEDLKDLILKDVDAETSGNPPGFTANERKNADVCFEQATKLVEKLWKKLSKKKSKSIPAAEDLAHLGASAIDFSLFDTLFWSFTKPGIEQRKAELYYLDLKIMMVKKAYRHPNATNADRSKAVQELDSLKKSKDIAFEALAQVKAERKARKRGKPPRERKGVAIDPHLTVRNRTPSSPDSGYVYRRAGSPPSQSRAYSDYSASYHHDYRDERGYQADYEVTMIREDIDKETFINTIERMLPRLQEQVKEEHEQKLAMLKEEEEQLEAARKAAVNDWKNRLVNELKTSKQHAAELKKQLNEAFENQVPDSQITKYVDEHQLQMLNKDEQSKELTELLSALGVEPTSATHDENSSEIETVQSSAGRRGSKLFKWFGQSSSKSGASTEKRRRHSRPAYTSSSSLYQSIAPQSDATSSIQDFKTFSVLISSDGRLSHASRIQLPNRWIAQYVEQQEKWYKTAAFRRTLHEYSTLDHESRSVVFDQASKEGLAPDDLVLLFAKRLDPKGTKRRRMMEVAVKFSAPWDFFHGRMFLVYKVKHDSGDALNGMRSVSQRGDAPDNHEPSRQNPRRDDHVNLDGYGDTRNDKSIVIEYDTRESGRENENPRDGGFKNTEDFFHPYRSRYKSYGINDPFQDIACNHSHEEALPFAEPDHRRNIIYPKIHRKYIAEETLRYYDLPYEQDRINPDYIVILRDMDKYGRDILFEHTRRLRSGKLLSMHDGRRSRASGRDRTPSTTIRRDSYNDGFTGREGVIDELADEAVKEYKARSRQGYDDPGSIYDHARRHSDLPGDRQALSRPQPRVLRSRSRSEYEPLRPDRHDSSHVGESRSNDLRWLDGRIRARDRSGRDDTVDMTNRKDRGSGDGHDYRHLHPYRPTPTRSGSRDTRRPTYDDYEERGSHSYYDAKSGFAQEAADEALERIRRRSVPRAKPGSDDHYYCPRRGILKPPPPALEAKGGDEPRSSTSDSESEVFGNDVSDSSSSSSSDERMGPARSRSRSTGAQSVLEGLRALTESPTSMFETAERDGSRVRSTSKDANARVGKADERLTSARSHNQPYVQSIAEDIEAEGNTQGSRSSRHVHVPDWISVAAAVEQAMPDDATFGASTTGGAESDDEVPYESAVEDQDTGHRRGSSHGPGEPSNGATVTGRGRRVEAVAGSGTLTTRHHRPHQLTDLLEAEDGMIDRSTEDVARPVRGADI